MKRLLLVIGLCFALVTPAFAQDSGWQLTDVISLEELTGRGSTEIRNAALAPDGSAIAWLNSSVGLCLYNFEAAATSCHGFPDTLRNMGRYSFLAWSPDSKFVAFSEDVLIFFVDSDVWVFDVEAETFTDHTEDGVYGSILEQEAQLDYLPTFHPVTGDLYFVRSERVEGGFTSALYLAPLGRDEVKLVHDWSLELPILSVYRPIVFSPDGTQLAMIVLGSQLDDERNGIWTMTLADGELQQVATIPDIQAGHLAGAEESALYPTYVSWAGEDALVVQSMDISLPGLMTNAYSIDLTSGTVTPLSGFSDLEMSDVMAEDSTAYQRMPRAGAPTPEGDAFIYLWSYPTTGLGGISSFVLPPDGGEPTILTEFEEFQLTPAFEHPPSFAPNGRALIAGQLLTFEAG